MWQAPRLLLYLCGSVLMCLGAPQVHAERNYERTAMLMLSTGPGTTRTSMPGSTELASLDSGSSPTEIVMGNAGLMDDRDSGAPTRLARSPAVPPLLDPPAGRGTPVFVLLLTTLLAVIIGLVLLYAVRHYTFTLNRLFGRQRHPYLDIDIADWPKLTVMIAAHNEEAVIAGSLECLLRADYPADRLTLMPVNDRSTDRTREIIDEYVQRFPGRITPFHRTGGKPGKAAALKDASALANSDIIVVFDADYLPAVGLLKQLVAPFFDPEVGATMGRVVPMNQGSNLLTRLLDLERSGGYQVDQQARMNLNLVPQYGGTVGGIRLRALYSAGGWHDDVLAEDTDLTYRLLLANWKTVYQNFSECYEEVPESWPVRIRQIMRWTKGHNQALYRHVWKMAACQDHGLMARVDGVALLGIYMMAPLMLFGWALAILLFYTGGLPFLGSALLLFALMSYGSLGNFAAFFEIAAAVYLDGSTERIRLLPLNYFGFLVSMLSVSRAILDQVIVDPVLHREFRWDKTARYRQRS